MSKPRKFVHITSGPVEPCACPNCGHELSGVTATMFGGFFESKRPKLKGHPSMCCYCGALLMFKDDAGRLRVMTAAERNAIRFVPEAQELLDQVKEGARKRGDFTRKTYN